MRRSRTILHQAPAHAHDVIDAIAKVLIEADGAGVLGPDLKVDLRAAPGRKSLLGREDKQATVPISSVIWVDSEVVEPTAVALVAGHHRSDNTAVKNPDQEQLRLDLELALDVAPGDAGRCQLRLVGCTGVATTADHILLGMQHEGRLREDMLLRDGWRDSNIYAILESEWPGR